MEHAVAERPVKKRRLWMRILAAILAAGLLATAGLVEASRVVFDKARGANEAERNAAGYLADTTEYLGEPLTGRMTEVLYAYLDEPVTYADHYLRMSVSIARGNVSSAADYCAACIRLWQDEEQPLSELWTKLACLHALLGEYAQAREELDTALSVGQADADPTMYLLRAQMSAQLGDAQGALGDIASYESLAGEDAALAAIKAPLYEIAGDYESAEAAYTVLLTGAGGEAPDPAACANRARVRFLLGDYAGARADAEAFFAADPAGVDGTARYIIATCALQEEDYALAAKSFELALAEGYPGPAGVYPSLVYARYMQGDLDGAKRAGEAALQIEGGESAELLQWMGVIELALGSYGEAADYFSRSAALDDARTDLYYYMGVCFIARNEYDKAVGALTQSIARGESLANSYYNRGVCYAALEDYENAYEDMQSALAASGDAELTASAADLRDKLAKALGK